VSNLHAFWIEHPGWLLGALLVVSLFVSDVIVRIALGIRDATELRAKPMPARLHCLKCGARHLDVGEWAKKPHRRHTCAMCGFKWEVRPNAIGAPDGA
jgi:hypothetical protein